MQPVFEDDFCKVAIQWSKPILYATAKERGSVHDKNAKLYMISVRFSDKPHKAVYIGKTYRQCVKTRLNQPDHRSRYAGIVRNYPKHRVFVRFGTIRMCEAKLTRKRLGDIENILIYCYDNDHSRNIKSIYKHGVTDSYQIISSGSRCELPACLSFGFFSKG